MVVVARAEVPAGRARPVYRLPEQVRVGGLSVLAALALWEIASRLRWINPQYISAPSAVVATGWVYLSTGQVWRHGWVSLQEFSIGFCLALVVGVGGGLLLGYYRPLRLLFDPLVMGLNATPRLALLPVIVVWLGIGLWAKSAIVFLGAVVPIMVNTIAGLQNVDPLLVRVARSFGARQGTIFLRVLLPASLPSVLAGVRLGLGRAVISVIVAEMFSSLAGVGYLLAQAGAGVKTDALFFLVILTAIFGYLAIALVQHLEARVASWRE